MGSGGGDSSPWGKDTAPQAPGASRGQDPLTAPGQPEKGAVMEEVGKNKSRR